MTSWRPEEAEQLFRKWAHEGSPIRVISSSPTTLADSMPSLGASFEMVGRVTSVRSNWAVIFRGIDCEALVDMRDARFEYGEPLSSPPPLPISFAYSRCLWASFPIDSVWKFFELP